MRRRISFVRCVVVVVMLMYPLSNAFDLKSVDCEKGECGGGLCLFQNCREPVSCGGGACKFISCTQPTCGGSTLFF